MVDVSTDILLESINIVKSISEQIITLSVAIIGFMITFRNKFPKKLLVRYKILLITSWGCYFFSIIFSILTLMSIAGSLCKNKNITIYDTNIKIYSSGMIISFIFATLLVIIIGIIIIFINDNTNEETTNNIIKYKMLKNRHSYK